MDAGTLLDAMKGLKGEEPLLANSQGLLWETLS